MDEGLPNHKNEHTTCEGCALGKQHSKEFSTHTYHRKHEILYLVHIDVCGPMQIRYLHGPYYFLIFIVDITRYTWVSERKVMFFTILKILIIW